MLKFDRVLSKVVPKPCKSGITVTAKRFSEARGELGYLREVLFERFPFGFWTIQT